MPPGKSIRDCTYLLFPLRTKTPVQLTPSVYANTLPLAVKSSMLTSSSSVQALLNHPRWS